MGAGGGGGFVTQSRRKRATHTRSRSPPARRHCPTSSTRAGARPVQQAQTQARSGEHRGAPAMQVTEAEVQHTPQAPGVTSARSSCQVTEGAPEARPARTATPKLPAITTAPCGRRRSAHVHVVTHQRMQVCTCGWARTRTRTGKCNAWGNVPQTQASRKKVAAARGDPGTPPKRGCPPQPASPPASRHIEGEGEGHGHTPTPTRRARAHDSTCAFARMVSTRSPTFTTNATAVPLPAAAPTSVCEPRHTQASTAGHQHRTGNAHTRTVGARRGNYKRIPRIRRNKTNRLTHAHRSCHLIQFKGTPPEKSHAQ